MSHANLTCDTQGLSILVVIHTTLLNSSLQSACITIAEPELTPCLIIVRLNLRCELKEYVLIPNVPFG